MSFVTIDINRPVTSGKLVRKPRFGVSTCCVNRGGIITQQIPGIEYSRFTESPRTLPVVLCFR